MTSFAGFAYLEKRFMGKKVRIETSAGMRVGKLAALNSDIVELEIDGESVFILPDKVVSICLGGGD